MSRDPSLRLHDIIQATSRIAEYIQGQNCIQFSGDHKTQSAVIRQFEIIGEAVKALSPEFLAKEPSIPWKQITGFRDVLSHSYFGVDPSVVWDAASTHAPLLQSACQRMLSS